MKNIVSKLKNAFLDTLLGNHALRQRLIFALKHKHWADLEITVPLGFALSCPVHFPEAWWSFKEIFLDAEYARAFATISLPERWIDLGCHAGYFSLYLAWLRAKQGLASNFKALLVDADARVEDAVRRLVAINSLVTQIDFAQGLIGSGDGQAPFVQRSHMTSSEASFSLSEGRTSNVAILKTADIFSLLAPPYDLIKVDLEGSEHDFLVNYQEVVKHTKHLILEWHSWHRGGGGKDQICKLAEDCGLRLCEELVAPHDVQLGSNTEQCGVLLFKQAQYI